MRMKSIGKVAETKLAIDIKIMRNAKYQTIDTIPKSNIKIVKT